MASCAGGPFTWPLSREILQAGYNQQADDAVIRTKMEAGADKLRSRYTTPIEKYGVSMLITYAERTSLEAFYNTTLQRGICSFNYTDPIDTTSYEYRFVGTPRYSSAGGLRLLVEMTWEKI